jgi:biopolymer transport protein ExbB
MLLSDTVQAWVMWLTYLPIVVCSMIGFGIALYKWLQLRHPFVPTSDAMAAISDLVWRGDIQAAANRAGIEPARGARLIETALAAIRQPRAVVEQQVMFAGRRLTQELGFGLGALALIASLGPLLGLLGTVVGIVLVFDRLAAGGTATPADLAGGIGIALYTTILGLIVGIIALVCHRYLTARVDRVVVGLEELGALVVTLVSEPRA